MTSRFAISLVCVVVVATACSSSTDDVANLDDHRVDDVVTTTIVEAATTVLEGPTTTFVPNLDGPFDTAGGLHFDPSTVDVIVEPEADPGALAEYPWPTDWTRRTVQDWSEFQPGLRALDPRDGIPPIDAPIFETVTRAAQWLSPRDPGALVQLGGQARFYPLSIMTRHEIVNDAIGDVPVAVTFCPLCNSAIAYDRRVNGEVLRFGVSGLLRNSDLVMWDEGTTSLWQQITGVGVVGEFAGAELESVPTSIVSFSQFAESFPDGKSLAGESADGRTAYRINPYTGYSSREGPYLYRGDTDDRLPALSRVVGVNEGDVVAAYSFERLATERVINDEVDGLALAVFLAGDTADALDHRVISSSQAIGSAVAHDPVVNGQTLTFVATDDGYFTDDQTGSMWSIAGISVDGELAGTQLGSLQHRNEFWFAWQAFFGPDSLRQG